MLYSAGLDTQAIILIVLVVVLVAVLIIMPIFTNKKNKKTVDDLHSSIKVGSKIMTIGGIIGTVLEIRNVSPTDKQILIETGEGSNKTTMLLDIKAIYQNMDKFEAPAAVGATSADVFDEKTKDEIGEEIKKESAKEEVSEVVAESATETAAASDNVASVEESKPAAATSTKKPIAKKTPASKK